MTSSTQDRLFDTFVQASGKGAQNLETLSGASDTLASALKAMAPAARGSEGTGASGKSTGSEAMAIAKTVLGSGLGLIPMVTGLLGLFGGGDDEGPAPLTKFAMPERFRLAGANTAGGVVDADYNQMGRPRSYRGAVAGVTSPGPGMATDSGGGGQAATQPGAQITVNVQAMDSRSFLDHSSEIAQAVRAAMLNLSSINDVVSDL